MAVDVRPSARHPRFSAVVGVADPRGWWSPDSALGSSWWARFLRYVGGVAVLAGLYYSAAKLGYVLGFTGSIAGIVWLPVGVGIAYLALGGLRFWPGALLGDLVANDYSTLPFGGALGQTLGNLV